MNRIVVAQELVKLAKELVSMEFPTDAAMKKYLREHPGADRSLHRVVKRQHTNVDELSRSVHNGLGDTPSNLGEVLGHAKESLSHLTPEQAENMKSKTSKKLESVNRGIQSLVDKYRKKSPEVKDGDTLAEHFRTSKGEVDPEDIGRLDAHREMRDRLQSFSDALDFFTQR